MRLHVFVPCGWGAALLVDNPVSMQKSLESPPPGLESTDVQLSVPELCSTNAASGGKRHRQTTAQGAAPSWRPSLRSITEDGNPKPAAAGVQKRGRSRSSRNKGTTMGTSRAPSRTEPKEFREYEVPILVPAFAPTAFSF